LTTQLLVELLALAHLNFVSCGKEAHNGLHKLPTTQICLMIITVFLMINTKYPLTHLTAVGAAADKYKDGCDLVMWL